MKSLFIALFVVVAIGGESAQADSWRPSSGHTQVPIWPRAVPNAIADPKQESVNPDGGVTNVSRPTITVYAASGRNTGVAAVVFPGTCPDVLQSGR